MADTSLRPNRDVAGGSFAELMDRVVWDYSPRDDDPSPLVSTARFFEEFPWDGQSQPAGSKEGQPSST